jgi:hypothetical protein
MLHALHVMLISAGTTHSAWISADAYKYGLDTSALTLSLRETMQRTEYCESKKNAITNEVKI